MDASQDAPRGSTKPAARQGVKPTGRAKRPGAKSVRVQLHLGATTAQRLGVHAAMTQRDKSRIADEILTFWLAEHGIGRELFEANIFDPEGPGIEPPTEDDRH